MEFATDRSTIGDCSDTAAATPQKQGFSPPGGAPNRRPASGESHCVTKCFMQPKLLRRNTIRAVDGDGFGEDRSGSATAVSIRSGAIPAGCGGGSKKLRAFAGAHNTVSEIERGARRVDVDDLMALAAALDVFPATLLMVPGDDPSAPVLVTGVDGEISADAFWMWLTANYPLPGTGQPLPLFASAWPKWEAERMENRLGEVYRSLVERPKNHQRGS